MWVWCLRGGSPACTTQYQYIPEKWPDRSLWDLARRLHCGNGERRDFARLDLIELMKPSSTISLAKL